MNSKNTKLLIIFLVLLISVGFAYLTANLAINASVGFKESSWDVHLDSIEVNENSYDLTKPIVDSKNTSLTFNATLNEPGDFYEFTVDVVNAGTMDAVLDNFVKSSLTSEQEEVIEYTVRSYGEGTLKTNTILHAGYSEKIIVRVEYKNNVDSLEHIDDLNCSLELHYVKRDLEHDYDEEVWNIDYIEDETTFIAKKTGTYKLEVWGASGGNGYNRILDKVSGLGGYGGYSTGNIKLNKEDKLYINVGGKGVNCLPSISRDQIVGGYNGGGNGGYNENSGYGGGGGATHIAFDSGELFSLSENKNSIIIVGGAGGGGGTFENVARSTSEINDGGSGGGFKGVDGQIKSNTIPSGGGTQEAGGTGQGIYPAGGFGLGGGNTGYGSGGGSGFYGGGAAFSNGASAGGGSGYIGNSLLTERSMYCYKCTISDVDSIRTETTDNVSSEPISKYAKIGNGFARITLLKD